MKKALSFGVALALTGLAASPASAALTTPLPDGESLWVMGVPDGPSLAGHIRELDPATGSLTGVFLDATVTSEEWNVGADYDPVTNAVYWIRNYGESGQSIVRYDVETDAETVFAAEGGTYDIRGIDVTDGVIRFSAYFEESDVVGVLTLDEADEEATASDVVDLGPSDNQSAIATDPTDGQLYLLTYECDLYAVNGSTPSLVISGEDFVAAGISEQCIAVDFDSNGRAWMTQNTTSNTASFDPSDIEGTLEVSEWEPPSSTEYGEALFVYGAGLASGEGDGDGDGDEESLASTGIDSGSLVGGAAALVAAGGFVLFARRRV